MRSLDYSAHAWNDKDVLDVLLSSNNLKVKSSKFAKVELPSRCLKAVCHSSQVKRSPKVLCSTSLSKVSQIRASGPEVGTSSTKLSSRWDKGILLEDSFCNHKVRFKAAGLVPLKVIAPIEVLACRSVQCLSFCSLELSIIPLSWRHELRMRGNETTRMMTILWKVTSLPFKDEILDNFI